MTQVINYQSNYQKLTQIVETLIDNNPLYQEGLNRQEMLELVNRIFSPIAIPDINSISEQELTKRIKSILSLHLVSGMLNDFTPEQMKIFDEAVKRGG
jgi:predicted DNA binding protein